jgi:AraC-like DNA-binding protein
LNIDKLSKLISSNRHHLSQVLNQKLGLSFYDYINTYRVNEAKILLTDAARADHKIAAIAYDAGFNSLSAFNDVFKKMTGQTPSQYRKQPADSLLVSRNYRIG